MPTLAALILAMLCVAGPPRCDSGCVANAEEGSAAPLPVQDEPRHRNRQPVDHVYPPPLGEPQRTPFRGDFWIPQERDRVFPEDGSRSGFETVVPPR